MAGFLDIKSGGRIRYNFVAAAGQTWNRGQVIVLNAQSQLEKLGANNYNSGVFAGLALETLLAAGVDNIVQNTNVAVAGSTVSVLAGEAVVVNDNLSGTGGWVPGQSTVYGQIGGNLSYNSASGLALGKCLESPVASGLLKFAFKPANG